MTEAEKLIYAAAYVKTGGNPEVATRFLHAFRIDLAKARDKYWQEDMAALTTAEYELVSFGGST